MFKRLGQYSRLILLAAGCAGCLAVFLGWLLFFREKPRAFSPGQTIKAPTAPTAPLVTMAAADAGHLMLCGLDLYDTRPGALVAKNFLHGAATPPEALHLRFDKRKLVATFGGGEVRQYSLSGEPDPAFTLPGGPAPRYALSEDTSTVLYCAQGDLWQASVDWENGKFINAARKTNVGYFEPQRFFGGVCFGTGKVLLCMMPTLRGAIRVDLDSGKVEDFPANLKNCASSPDNQMLAGIGPNKELFTYILDTNETKRFPSPPRSTVTKLFWMDNRRCVVVRNHQALSLLNRETMALSELWQAPTPIRYFARPSPGGRYVLAEVFRGYLLIDTVKPAASRPFPDDLSDAEWADDTHLLVNRRVTDSEKRGTWLVDVESGRETRLLVQPFSPRAVPHPSVVRLPGGGTALVLMDGDLWQFGLDGANPIQLTKTAKVMRPLHLIEPWPEPDTK